MKFFVIILTLICLGCATFYIWQPIHLQTYLLSTKIETKWITIEYDNPKCSPLEKKVLGREIEIPESGYVCTSSLMEMGWTYSKFYLVDNNKRVEITEDEQIFVRSALYINQGGCNVTAEIFLYESKNNSKAINERASFVEIYHPECQNRGVTTSSSEKSK